MWCERAALTVAAIGLAFVVPVQAATLTFSGQGTVTSTQGGLPRNGPAVTGSPLAFAFTFDTAALTGIDGDDQSADYDLPVTNFGASLGNYLFPLSTEQGFEPVLAISRGFSFFGQPYSESTLITTFYFASERSTEPSATTPFVTGAGTYGVLSLCAYFRTSFGETGVGPDQLLDPAGADRLEFTYTIRDSAVRQTGTVQGSFRGAFAIAEAVPEPATWGLMLAGFSLVGSTLRSRRRSTTVTYA